MLAELPARDRRDFMGINHWGAVERPTGKISVASHMLEAVEEMGNGRGMGKYLENVS
jgi:hypothetical protein